MSNALLAQVRPTMINHLTSMCVHDQQLRQLCKCNYTVTGSRERLFKVTRTTYFNLELHCLVTLCLLCVGYFIVVLQTLANYLLSDHEMTIDLRLFLTLSEKNLLWSTKLSNTAMSLTTTCDI